MTTLPKRPPRPPSALAVLSRGRGAPQAPVPMPAPRAPWRPLQPPDPIRVATMAGIDTRIRLEEQAAATRAALKADPSYGPADGPEPTPYSQTTHEERVRAWQGYWQSGGRIPVNYSPPPGWGGAPSEAEAGDES